MQKPLTIKIFAYITIFFAIWGLFGDIYLEYYDIFGLLRWPLAIFASYIGLKLRFYKLFEDEVKKLSINMLVLMVLVLFIFIFDFTRIGFFISMSLAIRFYMLKKQYDDWDTLEKDN
ncbi:hypothetical protein GCM10027035_17920 [Emticicia sediminis]